MGQEVVMDIKDKVKARASDQMERESKLDQTKMCARVVDGVVSLSGEIPTREVVGRAEQMARAALSALSLSIALPPDGIEIVLHNGMMKLIGEVDADYQRQAAIMAVTSVPGVKEVVNQIVVRGQCGRCNTPRVG